jgi:hypothetical protein
VAISSRRPQHPVSSGRKWAGSSGVGSSQRRNTDGPGTASRVADRSAGQRSWRTIRGRLSSSFSAASRCAGEWPRRFTPFGKSPRSRPLVFSLLPATSVSGSRRSRRARRAGVRSSRRGSVPRRGSSPRRRRPRTPQLPYATAPPVLAIARQPATPRRSARRRRCFSPRRCHEVGVTRMG